VLSAAQGVFPQWVQNLNIVLSFLGFLLTVYVTVQVWRIRRQYTARGRLPDLIKDLRAKGSDLNSRLSGWPQHRNEFLGEIKVARELLGAARKLLGRSDATTVRQIQTTLGDDAQWAALDDAGAWNLYSDVQRAIVSLEQVSKDLNWK
jgi:hypothetical protein